MKEIALFAYGLQPSVIYVLLAIIVRTSIPYLVRFYEEGNPVYQFTWDSWLYTVFEMFFFDLTVYINYLVMFAGIVDF